MLWIHDIDDAEILAFTGIEALQNYQGFKSVFPVRPALSHVRTRFSLCAY